MAHLARERVLQVLEQLSPGRLVQAVVVDQRLALGHRDVGALPAREERDRVSGRPHAEEEEVEDHDREERDHRLHDLLQDVLTGPHAVFALPLPLPRPSGTTP